MVRLVVDSICDLPCELIEKYNIGVLPLFVTIGDESYRDRVDIQLEQVYEKMRQGIVPMTSQISSGDTEELFRKICGDGDDLIYLSFSSGLSGTYQLANIIIEDLKAEYPDRKLEAIDSEAGSMGIGIIALQAARWAAQGRDFDFIRNGIYDMIPKTRHLFTLENLSWLAKGGRITPPAGYIGDKLQIKPILDIENKLLHVVTVVRGRKAAFKMLINMTQKEAKNFPKQLIGIAHADDTEAAETIEKMVKEAFPESKTFIHPIGCVLGSHLGIGGVGILFFTDPTEGYDLMDEDLV
ncbi:MAG: DegV family protein [Lachnospiraceae bacterium]|nr:DegV family protein [Candidatus Darwinimomas equi]